MEERYKIVKELGGPKNRKFGKTYLAVDIISQRKVVLKQFISNKNNNPLFQHVQLESTFSFEEPGLPKVIDYSIKENISSLILAYKEGIPIDQYWSKIKRKNRVVFLTEFIHQLIPLFNCLKSQQIVHCDIKPGNIIIEEKKNGFKVHLIDFGMATRKNTRRDVLFPLGYAAPELILNHLSIIDHRTDQFSLGVLIWKLYTGEIPLSHKNPSIFTNLQITHPLPEHSKIPRKIYPILLKMTKKHSFSIPPNRLKKEEVLESLIQGMNKRYTCLNEIKEDFKKIKPLFYQIRSRR